MRAILQRKCGDVPPTRESEESISSVRPASRFGRALTFVPAHASVTGMFGGPLPEDEPISITGNGKTKTPATQQAPSQKAPTAVATPPKLTKTKVSGPTAGDCGNLSWIVQWKLDQKSPKGGWVVQKVAYAHNIKTCDGKPFAPGGAGGGLDPSWYPLWEAWPVSKGEDRTDYVRDGVVGADDQYGVKPMDKTRGNFKITGTAEFFEGLSLPTSFKVTNKQPTWSLAATTSAPTLAGGSGSISHSIKSTWDCCKDSKSRKSVLEPE